MDLETLIIAILATWRVSCMIYFDPGPFELFERLRENLGVYITDKSGKPKTFLARQFSCFWCITFYVALLVGPVALLWPWPLIPLALSGGALLLSQGGRLIWRKMAED
jgi:hypothetical protein